jgi:hypothetical protein
MKTQYKLQQEFALEFAQDAMTLAIERCDEAGVSIARGYKDYIWKMRRLIIKGAIANMLEQELASGRLTLSKGEKKDEVHSSTA